MEKHVSRSTVCIPSDNVVARVIEDDMIIVPLVAGIGDADDELYTLNETGQAIWQKLDGEKTLGQVADSLRDEFSAAAEEINADVLGFAAEMIRRGMLVTKD